MDEVMAMQRLDLGELRGTFRGIPSNFEGLVLRQFTTVWSDLLARRVRISIQTFCANGTPSTIVHTLRNACVVTFSLHFDRTTVFIISYHQSRLEYVRHYAR